MCISLGNRLRIAVGSYNVLNLKNHIDIVASHVYSLDISWSVLINNQLINQSINQSITHV